MPKKKKKDRRASASPKHAKRTPMASPSRLLKRNLGNVVKQADGTYQMRLGDSQHTVELIPEGDHMRMAIPAEAYSDESWRDLPGSDMHTLPAVYKGGHPLIVCYRDLSDEMLLSDGNTDVSVASDEGPIAKALERSGSVRVAGFEEAVQLPVTTGWTYRITGMEYHCVRDGLNMYRAGLVLRDRTSQKGPAYYDGSVIGPRNWFDLVKDNRRLVVCSLQSKNPLKMWASVAHPMIGTNRT